MCKSNDFFCTFGNKVLYTHQKMKKSKVWQDGVLKTTLGNKVSAKQLTLACNSCVLAFSLSIRITLLIIRCQLWPYIAMV